MWPLLLIHCSAVHAGSKTHPRKGLGPGSAGIHQNCNWIETQSTEYVSRPQEDFLARVVDALPCSKDTLECIVGLGTRHSLFNKPTLLGIISCVLVIPPKLEQIYAQPLVCVGRPRGRWDRNLLSAAVDTTTTLHFIEMLHSKFR